MIYIIGGEKCIELSMESDHRKLFFYKGRYFVNYQTITQMIKESVTSGFFAYEKLLVSDGKQGSL